MMRTPEFDPKNLYVWFDLETNGISNPADPAACIFEVAFQVTNNWLLPVGEPFTAVPWVTDQDLDLFLREGPPVVVEMHRNNGLVDNLRTKYPTKPGITAIDHDASYLLDSISWENHKEHSIYPDFILCGSGVSHFDNRWLETHLPNLWSRFKGYNPWVKPTIDFGVVRRYFSHFTDFDFEDTESTHRALDDVKHFINEAKLYRDTLTSIANMVEEKDSKSPEDES